MGIFDQPLLGYSPNLEPPGWNLLRQMLMSKIFQLQGNPYGFNPGAGQSQGSLWNGAGRGLMNPYTGAYGPAPGAQGPGAMNPNPQFGSPLAQLGARGTPQTATPPPSNPMFNSPRALGQDGYDGGFKGFSPMRGGDIQASHAIKNPMDRHMMLRALIGHLMGPKMPRQAPQAPIPLGQDSGGGVSTFPGTPTPPMRGTPIVGSPTPVVGYPRMHPIVAGPPRAGGALQPVGPGGPSPTSSPDTSGAGGIPRTVPGGTSRPPTSTTTGTATQRSGGGGETSGTKPEVGGGARGRGDDIQHGGSSTLEGWNPNAWQQDPTPYPDPGAFPWLSNQFNDRMQVYRNNPIGNWLQDPIPRPPDANPGIPSGPKPPGALDGERIGYDAPYMFQRAQTGPLGMDANNGSYSVGVHGGTLTNFPNIPGQSLFVPWGSNFDDMVQQFLSSFAGQGDTGAGGAGGTELAGGGGGGAGGGGGGFGFRKKQRVLGMDGSFMDQPNNYPGGRDFGMRSGDAPSSVGPYKAPQRPSLADGTQWGNW